MMSLVSPDPVLVTYVLVGSQWKVYTDSLRQDSASMHWMEINYLI
jgi:hypothetical protein